MEDIAGLLSHLNNLNNFSIDLTLPSSNKKVKVREMLIKDQMNVFKCAQAAPSGYEESMYLDMLNSIVIHPAGFDSREVPEEDVTYLLIYNRISTHGPEVSLLTKCNGKIEGNGICGEPQSLIYNLSERNVLNRIEEALSGLYPMKLEIGDYTIHLTYLKETDNLAIEDNLLGFIHSFYSGSVNPNSMSKKDTDKIKSFLKMSGRISKIEYKDKGTIKSYDVINETLEKKVEIFMALPAVVSYKAIEEVVVKLSDVAEKLTDKLEYTCEKCGNKGDVPINMLNKSFFVDRF